MIDEMTEEVIRRIKQRYILVEKTFNMNSNDYITEEMVRDRVWIENAMTILCQSLQVDKALFDKRPRAVGRMKIATLIFVKILRDLPEEPFSYSKIGRYIKKDHATIMHSYKVANTKYERDFEFKSEYLQVKKQIEQSLKTW